MLTFFFLPSYKNGRYDPAAKDVTTLCVCFSRGVGFRRGREQFDISKIPLSAGWRGGVRVVG